MASHGPRAQVANLFSTPLLSERWSEAGRANPALREAILAQQAANPGETFSNVGGWQSPTTMIDWGGASARLLLDHVIARCGEVTTDVAARGSERFAWRGAMWANVNASGAFNQMHCHPGAVWSAVYYVDDGYAGSTDAALGGELSFLDPRFPMVRMNTPDLRFRRADGSYDNQDAWLRPASGLLVIFPSWLMHNVRPYRGGGIRISIAINLFADPKAATR